MATIQAMLATSAIHDLKQHSRISIKNSVVRALPTNFAQRLALSSSRSRNNFQVTCQADRVDPWENGLTQPDTFSQYSGYIAEASLEEADQLDEYNAEKIAAVFKRRPFLLARRLIQIAGTLGWWAAVRYIDVLLGRSDTNFKVCGNFLALGINL